MNKISLVALSVVLGLSGCAQDKPTTETTSVAKTTESTLSRAEIDKVVEQYLVNSHFA